MISFCVNRKFNNKYIFLFFIIILLGQFLNCINTYKIADSEIEKIKLNNSTTLEFSFKELNETQGNPHVDETWRCFLIINDIDYYNCWYFQPDEIIRVPIPSGEVSIDFRLSNMSKFIWCGGRFDYDKTTISLTTLPGEIIKIKVKSIDRDVETQNVASSSLGTAGPAGIGCLILMPREYYIHLDIEK